MSKNPIISNILSDGVFIDGCNRSSGRFSWLHTKQLAILKISNDFFFWIPQAPEIFAKRIYFSLYFIPYLKTCLPCQAPSETCCQETFFSSKQSLFLIFIFFSLYFSFMIHLWKYISPPPSPPHVGALSLLIFRSQVIWKVLFRQWFTLFDWSLSFTVILSKRSH